MTLNGAPVFSCFFQQSSFATSALATERNVVKVPEDVPLELLAALPCGVNTGAGAVLNVLRPQPGEAFAVMGYNTWVSTFCPFFDWKVLRRIAVGHQERLEAIRGYVPTDGVPASSCRSHTGRDE
jgi:D-arabinose 1-dehydrogenase-like Zn-dependent alcohol dehydrogenase